MLALAACGGGGGTGPSSGTNGGTGGNNGDDDDGGGGGPIEPLPESPFNQPSEDQALFYALDFRPEFNAVRDNSEFGGVTPYANLPRPTIVTFSGWMELAFETTPNASIHSEAFLDVNMETGETMGSASDFIGWAFNPNTQRDEVALYEGNVLFSGGSLETSTDGTGNSFAMQIDTASELNNGLQEFTVSGQIKGAIYGANADGIFAYGTSSPQRSDIALTANNVVVNGTAGLWALKD